MRQRWEYAFLAARSETTFHYNADGKPVAYSPGTPEYCYGDHVWLVAREAFEWLGTQGWEYMGDSPSGFVFKRPAPGPDAFKTSLEFADAR